MCPNARHEMPEIDDRKTLPNTKYTLKGSEEKTWLKCRIDFRIFLKKRKISRILKEIVDKIDKEGYNTNKSDGNTGWRKKWQ